MHMNGFLFNRDSDV